MAGALLISLYSFLVLVPILILLLGPKFSSRPGLLDLSVSVAFVGLAIMAMQFILSARIKKTHEPFGTDLVYHFHRQMGIAAFLLVFSHPILLFILDTRYLRLLNIFSAASRVQLGIIAVSTFDRSCLDGGVPAEIQDPILVLETMAWHSRFGYDPPRPVPYFHWRELYRPALEKSPLDHLQCYVHLAGFL